MLHKKQLEKYIAIGGTQCPYCGSEHLDCDDIDIDNGGACQPVFCGDCEKSWLDVYVLKNIIEMEE